jgi:hypothetical protein
MSAQKKRRKRRSVSTRKSSGSGLSVSGMLNEVKTPALVLLGAFAGKKAAEMLASSGATKAVSGLVGVDAAKLLKPVVLAAGGVMIARASKKAEYKTFGYGIAAMGGAILMRDQFGVNVLSGVDGDDTLPELEESMRALTTAMNGGSYMIEGLRGDDIEDFSGIDGANENAILIE